MNTAFKPINRVIILLLLLSAFSSCYQYDPIDSKERMLENLKNKGVKPPQQGGEGEKPIPTPVPTPTPKPNPDTPHPENPKEEFIQHYFSFDTWKQVPSEPYYIPINTDNENPANSYWVSASNNGYTNFTQELDKFPVLELKEGYKNSGVELISRPPLGWKATFSPQIIAGALYAGKIEGGKMNQNPVRFGHRWTTEPVKLSVYVKYKAGEKAIGNLQDKDQGSISAVFYEVTNNKTYLDKYTINNDSRIILKAYTTISEETEWKELSLDFKVINQELYKDLDLKKKQYRLAIIFSSSARGDEYIGALGSRLCVDELTIFSKKEVATEQPKPEPTPEPKPTPNPTMGEVHFGFELWKEVPNTKYKYSMPFLSEDEEPSLAYWASNNSTWDNWGTKGVLPLVKVEEGKQGSSVELISRGFYEWIPAGYRFVSGLLYSGQAGDASKGQRTFKQFGKDWDKGEPKTLKLYYQYQSAKNIYDNQYGGFKGIDKGSIRAILYEVTNDTNYYLDNREHKAEENERIILEAYQEVENQSDWTELSLEFEVKNEERYKAIDFKIKKYRLAIIISSSHQWLKGKGLKGSTMRIDELSISYKEQ